MYTGQYITMITLIHQVTVRYKVYNLNFSCTLHVLLCEFKMNYLLFRSNRLLLSFSVRSFVFRFIFMLLSATSITSDLYLLWLNCHVCQNRVWFLYSAHYQLHQPGNSQVIDRMTLSCLLHDHIHTCSIVVVPFSSACRNPCLSLKIKVTNISNVSEYVINIQKSGFLNVNNFYSKMMVTIKIKSQLNSALWRWINWKWMQ